MFSLNKNRFAIAMTVVAIMFIFFAWRQFSDTVKVGDVFMFAFFATVIIVLPVAAKCDEILRLLRGLEPKTGSVTYSYSGDSVGANATDKSRYELTLALIHSIAPPLCHRLSSEELGAYIQGVLNGVFGAPDANSACAARTAEQLATAKAGLAIYGQLAASGGAMHASTQPPSEMPEAGPGVKHASDGLTHSNGCDGHKCLIHQLPNCPLCSRHKNPE